MACFKFSKIIPKFNWKLRVTHKNFKGSKCGSLILQDTEQNHHQMMLMKIVWRWSKSGQAEREILLQE